MATPYAIKQARRAAELEWLIELFGPLSEGYGEMVAEFRNECAMFGDAWPGAQIQLRETGSQLSRIERRIRALEAKFPAPARELTAEDLLGDPDPFANDIPF